MEYRRLSALDRDVSRIGIGTWAIGGVHWGGTDPARSIEAIQAGLDRGVNLIDTAPVYGFGLSEEIVGSAIRDGSASRDEVIIATKAGLEWQEGVPSSDAFWRNAAPDRLREEVEASLQRFQTDYIDIYQVHWPDPDVPVEETAEEMNKLKKEGKIRAVGVSNFSPEQMDAFQNGNRSLDTCQPPYNLFEPGSREEVLPYCRNNDIYTMTYSVLCRGLLTSTISEDRDFPPGDLRRQDPKFQPPRFSQYLKAVRKLDEFARETHDRRVHHLAARWALDTGADTVLWGVRTPEQTEPFEEIDGWSLSERDLEEIDSICEEAIVDPVESGLPEPAPCPEEA